MRIGIYILMIPWILPSCVKKSTNPLDKILLESPKEIKDALLQKDKYDLQILYTQVERTDQNIPILKSYSYNLDTTRYFYPASTVKMPVAFLAIEKINQLRADISMDISLYNPILIDSVSPPQTSYHVDTTSSLGYPTVAGFIEQIFSVSDNNAYNRLYEFLGQDYINDALRAKEIFSNSRIRTRLSSPEFDTESNRYSNPYRILDQSGSVIYKEVERYALHNDFEPLTVTAKGTGYFSYEYDKIVKGPFEMSEKNFINLVDLESSLRRVIFPELYGPSQQFDISDGQYDFLYKTMSSYPSDYPQYLDSDEEYSPGYAKFFIVGDGKIKVSDNVKILGITGWAYGYLTESSYIVDLKNHVEFFLTATIYANTNQIFNDNRYEYEEVARPFLAELGRQLYHYELGRKRMRRPNLDKFKTLNE